MRRLLAAPATNDRGPRYMQQALTAFHQASPIGSAVVLSYDSSEDRVGLFIEAPDELGEQLIGPIFANFPNASLANQPEEQPPSGWQRWSAEATLTPELFPILRHAQFEDLSNGSFTDPVSAILRAVKPEANLRCRIVFRIMPAPSSRVRAARKAVRLLERRFFAPRPRLAEFYAVHATQGAWKLPCRLLAWLASATAAPTHTSLDISSGRVHDREGSLQAASDKLGGHLFAVGVLPVRLPESFWRVW